MIYLYPNFFGRLSVSETAEWVCTKSVFANGTVRRHCEKTYTGDDHDDLDDDDYLDIVEEGKIIATGR